MPGNNPDIAARDDCMQVFSAIAFAVILVISENITASDGFSNMACPYGAQNNGSFYMPCSMAKQCRKCSA